MVMDRSIIINDIYQYVLCRFDCPNIQQIDTTRGWIIKEQDRGLFKEGWVFIKKYLCD